jgi:hypothetical protein
MPHNDTVSAGGATELYSVGIDLTVPRRAGVQAALAAGACKTPHGHLEKPLDRKPLP